MNKGTKEQRNKGTKEKKEKKKKGTKEQRNKGTKEQCNNRTKEQRKKGTKKLKVHPIGSGITRSPGLVLKPKIIIMFFSSDLLIYVLTV